MTIDRDFVAEMNEVLDRATSAEPYVPAVIAAEIADGLRSNDPELLDGWLHAGAAQFLRMQINARDHSNRSVIASRKAATSFAAAVEAHERGDGEPLGTFLRMRFTTEDGARKQLADLTKVDLLFVASAYQDRADRNLLRAEFMRALAAKVGDGTVADRFSEHQISEMLSSVSAA